MRWRPAFLLPLALALGSSGCLPPKLELDASDGAAGQGGSASPDVYQPKDGDGAGSAGRSDGRSGAAGTGGAGQDGSAGSGGIGGGSGGNGGGAGRSGSSGGGVGGSGGAGDSGNAGGSGGAAGRSGASGTGGTGGSFGGADGGPTRDATGGAAGAGGGAKDAASDVPTSPSCYDEYPNDGSVLFCDNFEDTTLRWTTYRAEDAAIDGETRRDTTVRHRGNGALYSRKDGLGDGTPVYVDALGDRKSGPLFLRTWLYLQAPLPGAIPKGSTASLLVLGERAYPFQGVGLALAQDALGLTIRGQVDDHVAKPMYVMQNDRWVCLQIDFAVGPAAIPRIRIDGQNLNAVICPGRDAGTCNTLLGTSYGRLWMGINWSNYAPDAGPKPVVFYDDVVVSTVDIACN